MKRSELKKIIDECYREVLSELDSDDAGVMKISKNDPQKQQKVQQAKQNQDSYEVYDPSSLEEMETDFANDDELAEMARIPTLYSLEPGWEEALNSNEKLKKSATIQSIISYLKEKPEGASILDIAKNAFETPKRQQKINPLFPVLVDAGLVQNKGLKSEPKKPSQGKKPDTSVDDDGEALFGGEDGDAEDYAVGFAGDYDKAARVDADDEEGEDTFPTDEPGDNASEDFDEPEFGGGGDHEEEGHSDEEELSRLTAEKDALVSRLKKGEITKDEYKSFIGDIPSRIKALRNKLEGGEEDIDESPTPIFEGKRRLMKLAGLIKG